MDDKKYYLTHDLSPIFTLFEDSTQREISYTKRDSWKEK